MNLIEKITEKYANDKAEAIDAFLLQFLAESRITHTGTVEDIKANLLKNGYEIVQTIEKTLSQEVYTFKICRVWKTKQLTIPNPFTLN